MKASFIYNIKDRINSITDSRKKKLINSILKNDNWYLNVSLDTFVNVLMDLKYSKEEAFLLFKKLNIPE